MTDNEAIFTAHTVRAMFQRKGITHVLAPIRHSTSNAQVERLHRTLLEMGRCLAEQRAEELEDIILDTVHEYNNTIHSVTKAKPIDVFYHQENFPNIADSIRKAQAEMLKSANKNRVNKTYDENQTIFVKNNRRNKKSPAYTKHKVKRDVNENIITNRNVKVHKDHIRK